jgi:hypothetical protein
LGQTHPLDEFGFEERLFRCIVRSRQPSRDEMKRRFWTRWALFSGARVAFALVLCLAAEAAADCIASDPLARIAGSLQYLGYSIFVVGFPAGIVATLSIFVPELARRKRLLQVLWFLVLILWPLLVGFIGYRKMACYRW